MILVCYDLFMNEYVYFSHNIFQQIFVKKNW